MTGNNSDVQELVRALNRLSVAIKGSGRAEQSEWECTPQRLNRLKAVWIRLQRGITTLVLISFLLAQLIACDWGGDLWQGSTQLSSGSRRVVFGPHLCLLGACPAQGRPCPSTSGPASTSSFELLDWHRPHGCQVPLTYIGSRAD